MLNFGNKEFRNLQEQVLKNADDLEEIKQSLGTALPNPIPGPQGPAGQSIIGPKGERGSIWTVGTDFPASPRENDLHLKNSEVYQYIDGQWVLYGSIKGNQGVQGVRGLQGESIVGPQGPIGPQGVGSPIYVVAGKLNDVSQLPDPTTVEVNTAYIVGNEIYGLVNNEWTVISALLINNLASMVNLEAITLPYGPTIGQVDITAGTVQEGFRKVADNARLSYNAINVQHQGHVASIHGEIQTLSLDTPKLREDNTFTGYNTFENDIDVYPTSADFDGNSALCVASYEVFAGGGALDITPNNITFNHSYVETWLSDPNNVEREFSVNDCYDNPILMITGGTKDENGEDYYNEPETYITGGVYDSQGNAFITHDYFLDNKLKRYRHTLTCVHTGGSTTVLKIYSFSRNPLKTVLELTNQLFSGQIYASYIRYSTNQFSQVQWNQYGSYQQYGIYQIAYNGDLTNKVFNFKNSDYTITDVVEEI